MTDAFLKVKKIALEQIVKSKTPEDPSHADNTMFWISRLKPDADEILLLAGYCHDIERSMPDKFTRDMFDSYDEYKQAHAERAGSIAAKIALDCGYTKKEAIRLGRIIANGEFNSDDPDIQLLCDADSISFFDNNLDYYLNKHGAEATKKKINFMYERASVRAKTHIRNVLKSKPNLDLLKLA